jgi:hypothetical protein
VNDEGAFPVVEAILVAILVLSAVLFFTSVQRPTAGTESRGIDLGQVATDTLDILNRRTFADPANGSSFLKLEDWVNKTLQGDAATAAEVDGFLNEALPQGTRHLVRLNNGVDTLALLPLGWKGDPQGARAAEIPLFSHWQKYATQNLTDRALAGRGIAAPGQLLNSTGQPTLYSFTQSATIKCIRAPYRDPADATKGASKGPGAAGGVDWVTRWQGQAAGQQRVPANVPYGVWAGYTSTDCATGARYARVALPGGLATDYPLYGLQLVVWFGA